MQVGDGWCRSFAVVGYPREVALGWLEPLAAHPGRLDVSVHIEPVPAQVAADRLRRQLARLESDRRADAAKGRLGDPEVEVAAFDARELAAGIARGEQRLFRVGLYLTVHARTEEALDAECTRVRALCSSMLLDVQAATWRSLQGWTTTLPLGVDALSLRRSFDTDALAASFPFASAELSEPTGVLYGTAAKGSGLVLWDRFAQDNHNSVILARSGAGKSYLAKLEVLRSLYAGIEVAVVDPEDEYRRLADAVGGSYIHLGAPGVRLNPFDLSPGPEPLVRQALFIHTLVAVLVGEDVTTAAKPVLDRAILAAYDSVGITTDHRTHVRPAPVLADLAPCARSRRRGRSQPGRSPGPLRHRIAPRALRWADHDPARGPSRRLLAPRSARRGQGCRHAAHARRSVEEGVGSERTPAPAGGGRRSLAAHVRDRRGKVPFPHGQIGSQTLVRSDGGDPRRRRSLGLTARPSRRGQRGDPNIAATSTPDDRRLE